jgi:predicted nucleic acid-binding Zn ribbon protein
MDAASNHGNQEVLRLVQQFDERLRLARATELAASNRLLEAESLLWRKDAAEASVSELDLLARIQTKKGCFVEARRCWERAISLDEGKRAKFEECLRSLEEYSFQRMRRRKIEWWLTLALLISSFAISIWTLSRINFMIPK